MGENIIKVSRTVRESLDGTFTNNNLTNIVTTLPTNGAAVTVAKFTRKSVFINKPVATGTAIVRVEASADKVTWLIIDSKTMNSVATATVFSTDDYFPYLRTSVTALVGAATVSTIITGHGV